MIPVSSTVFLISDAEFSRLIKVLRALRGAAGTPRRSLFYETEFPANAISPGRASKQICDPALSAEKTGHTAVGFQRIRNQRVESLHTENFDRSPVICEDVLTALLNAKIAKHRQQLFFKFGILI